MRINQVLSILFQRIKPNEPYCSIYNEITSKVTSNKLKGSDPAYVDYVAVDVKNKKRLQKVSTPLQPLYVFNVVK